MYVCMHVYVYIDMQKTEKVSKIKVIQVRKGGNRSNRGGGVLVLSSAIQTVKHICIPGFSGGDF